MPPGKCPSNTAQPLKFKDLLNYHVRLPVMTRGSPACQALSRSFSAALPLATYRWSVITSPRWLLTPPMSSLACGDPQLSCARRKQRCAHSSSSSALKLSCLMTGLMRPVRPACVRGVSLPFSLLCPTPHLACSCPASSNEQRQGRSRFRWLCAP